ncbi:MAG: nucleoside hydrolase [Ardenticatenaceae bacterium]|nr:nucleoside hydrolase [Ardenticatenaceae bacterium]
MQRLIIDTDPGVDDAQAILMAAAHPQAKIEAIMAVGGNVGLEHTVRNSLTLVELVEQDIPVYAGCAHPLVLQGENAAFVHGEDGMGGAGFVPHHKTAETEHASAALARLAAAEPGEFTLLAIGPLTNIAVALRLDPQLPHNLKRLVVMGGAVTAHGNTKNVSAEFNIFADPEAAHVVFEAWGAAGKIIELVDWEVTMRHPIPYETLDRWFSFKTAKSEFFRRISADTIKFVSEILGRKALFGADPLAMTATLEPESILKSEDRYVTVEINGRYTRGQTTVDWHNRLGRPANTRIVLEVDIGRFHQLLENGLK